MKHKFLFLLLTITFQCISQEKYFNSHDSIYIEDNIFYKVKDKQIFTGTIEFIKKNGHLTSKENYKNGYLIKDTDYYSKTKDVLVYKETYFYEKEFFKKQKEIRYHYNNGEIYSIKYYDLDGNMTLEESYDANKLVYSCEYKNGKKHGKEFCISKKCDLNTEYYKNGKRVK